MIFVSMIGTLLWFAPATHGLPQQMGAKVECVPAETLVDRGQPLSELVRRAKRGSAIDQYRLGLRYESGIDVPQDLAQARKLYRAAIRQQSELRWAHSPAVGSEAHGRVVSGGSPRTVAGAAEATVRFICMGGMKGPAARNPSGN